MKAKNWRSFCQLLSTVHKIRTNITIIFLVLKVLKV